MHHPMKALSVTVSAVACVTLPMPAYSSTVGRGVAAVEVSGFSSVDQMVTNLKKAAAWSALRMKVDEWGGLPADWDGMGGAPASQSVCSSAQMMIDNLQLAGMALPQADFAGDGEITFRWVSGADVATVSYLADGHVVGIVRAGDRAPYKFDEPVSSFFPAELFDRLVRFS